MPPAPGHFPWSPWWNQDPRSRAEPRGKEPPPEDNGEQHSAIPRSTKNRGGGQDSHTTRYWLLSVKERRHPLPQSGNISMVLENGEVMSRRRASTWFSVGPQRCKSRLGGRGNWHKHSHLRSAPWGLSTWESIWACFPTCKMGHITHAWLWESGTLWESKGMKSHRMGLVYKPYNGPKNQKGKTIVAPWSYVGNNGVDPQIRMEVFFTAFWKIEEGFHHKLGD